MKLRFVREVSGEELALAQAQRLSLRQVSTGIATMADPSA